MLIITIKHFLTLLSLQNDKALLFKLFFSAIGFEQGTVQVFYLGIEITSN
jgi:hypothetical protein